MTSRQGRSPSDDKKGADLEPILEELGHRGRYQITQLLLNVLSSFLYTIPVLDVVFMGYQPDYQCSPVENITQLEAYLPKDVINFTLHDVSYQQCSIDVTVNSSGTSSTHSLPCVAGVNFSMPSDTSFLTEWSLVCDKAGLSELTQTGLFGGQIAGGFMFAMVDDRYGRKKVYVFCALCSALILIARSLVPSYDFFLVCKIAAGFFTEGMVLASYTMFMELLPQQSRFVASVIDSIAWSCACLFMALVAYCLQGFSWRYLGLALASGYVFTLLLPWFLDESLRWLLATGGIEEAERILEKACRMNGKDFENVQAMLHKQVNSNTSTNNSTNNSINNSTNNSINNSNNIPGDFGRINSTNDFQEEVMKIEDTMEEQNKEVREHEMQSGSPKAEEMVEVACTSGKLTGMELTDRHDDSVEEHKELTKLQEEVFSAKYTVLDLFRYRVVFVPFLVTIFVWVTADLYFYAVILGSANLSGNRFLNFSLLNLQDIPSNLVAFFLLNRFNRRPLAFVYGILAGCFLLISVGLVVFGGEGVTLTLATVAEYIGMFSLTGSYTLLFVYYMEVYPTALRAVGTGTAGTIVMICNLGAPFLVLWAEKSIWAPGVLLGCLCCLASCSIWLLPETRHRKLPDTIEEIQSWKRKELVL